MKTTFNFDQIHNLNKAMKSAAADVSAAESALVAAAQEAEAAKQDDGKTAPEVILERIASAEKTHRLRTIEANRAGAKLAEAEASFHQEVLESAPKLVTVLGELAASVRKDLAERILAVDGLDDSAAGQVSQLVESSGKVRAIVGAAARIQQSLDSNGIYVESTNVASAGLIQNVFSAEEFVSR